MVSSEWSKKLVRFFEEMLGFYRKFLALEQEKYTVLISGKPEDLKKLDGYMKREQAFALKARGFESDRQKMLTEAQAPQGTLRELIAQIDPASKADMQKLYQELSDVIAEVQSTNKKCARITKIKIDSVSHVLSNIENHPELRKIYGDQLKDAEKSKTVFSEKV